MTTPTIKLETITPSKARKLLEHANKDNRPINKVTVEQYTRDMLSGQWSLTGDTIKMNGNGTLIDGQHRLSAIVASNIPVQSYVVR